MPIVKRNFGPKAAVYSARFNEDGKMSPELLNSKGICVSTLRSGDMVIEEVEPSPTGVRMSLGKIKDRTLDRLHRPSL
jgi:hypothetical protein